ncbi:unnamed protein product [Sphagnum jensenii]|uniref:Uncharacterized protein n=1 Tax=Sphagnum jensenii TaxID=128206 RepID=A0ABP1BEQ4_9BRYO
MELLALNASIESPLDACSSRSARVAASSSWLPHKLECFRVIADTANQTLGDFMDSVFLKVDTLPIFGVGHSFGALAQLLIATSAIPLLSPVLGPVAQNFSPILAQLTASPTLRLGAEIAVQQLKQFESVSPPIVKQVLPLIEQLPPLYVDLANGKDQFVPTPDETDRLIKTSYGIGENLLIKFKDDQIDETLRLAQTLSSNSAVSGFLDMSVRVLPGDHARTLLQVFPVVPPNMARTINRGSELSSTMPAGSPSAEIAKGLRSNPTAQQLREEVIENVESLIDEIASWMTASA